MQLLLLRGNQQLGVRKMYELARGRFLAAEGGQGDDGSTIARVAKAVAQVTDGISAYARAKELGGRYVSAASGPQDPVASGSTDGGETDPLGDLFPPLHIWSAITDVYTSLREEEERSLAAPRQLQYAYFARDVLLACFAEDKAATVEILATAYRYPARMLLRKKEDAQPDDFADSYQNAIVNLLKKTFDPDQVHTAQLFTIFFRIVTRRFQDQGRAKERRNRADDNYGQISAPERHNSTSYNDYITDKHNLNELFDGEEIGAILTKALKGIGQDCRRLLQLLFFHGYSYQKAAETMEYKANGIGKRRERCLKKLGDHLDPGQIKAE